MTLQRSSLAGLILLTLAATAQAQTLPLDVGDRLRYADLFGSTPVRNQEVLNDWAPYYEVDDFLGLARTLPHRVYLASVSDRIYVADLRARRWVKLLDFSAPVGTTWPVPLTGLHAGSGSGTMTLVDDRDTVMIDINMSFTCYRFDYRGPAGTNDGWDSVWVAPGVGVVKWTERTRWGTNTYELLDASVGGVSHQRYTPPPYPYASPPAHLSRADMAGAQLLPLGTLTGAVAIDASQAPHLYRVPFNRSLTFTFQELALGGYMTVATYDGAGRQRGYTGSSVDLGRSTQHHSDTSPGGSHFYIRVAMQTGNGSYELEVRR